MKDVEEVGGDFKEVFLFVRRKAGVIEVMSKSTRFVGIFVIEVDKFFSGENYGDFFIVRRIFSFVVVPRSCAMTVTGIPWNLAIPPIIALSSLKYLSPCNSIKSVNKV